MARANIKRSLIFSKLFLIVVNFLFLIMGIAVLALGIYCFTNTKPIRFSKIFERLEALRSVSFLLIACGSLIVAVALCGFLGACMKNRFIIILYTILCTLILIGNVTSLLMVLVNSKKVKSLVTEQIKKRMDRYYGANDTAEPGSDAFTKGIDDIQEMEQCCGWSGLGGVNFFATTPWFTKQDGSKLQFYPDSCCPDGAPTGPGNKEWCVRPIDEYAAREAGHMHKDDCYDKMTDVNSDFARIVLASVVEAILLQIIGIICAIVIVYHMGAKKG